MPAKKPAVKTSAARNAAVAKRRNSNNLSHPSIKGEAGRINKETGLLDLSCEGPLTEMQLAFVREWAQGNNILASATRAGYAVPNVAGYVLSRKPKILLAYQQEKEKWEKSADMTRKKVMEGLMDSIAMAQMLAEPSTMVAGWREVAKLCGYYEPIKIKHEVSVNGKIVTERLNQMSDDELLGYIEQRAQLMAQVPQLTHGETPDAAEGTAAADGDGA